MMFQFISLRIGIKMRYAQLVMGPAGSGKSTYCNTIRTHCETLQRTVHMVNLDPAAEEFNYPVSVDIRELVQVDDVMEAEDLRLGPNGGLVFCMEYLSKNLDWLHEQLGTDEEDDYVIFDCPGQIELYTHIPVMKHVVDSLHAWDFRVCGVFIVDAQFLVDAAKYFSGVLSALSAMVQLEIPHVNIMTKMDLLSKKDMQDVEKYLNPEAGLLVNELTQSLPVKYKRLNKAISSLIDDYSLVNFIPLNVKEEESIHDVLTYVDNSIQYGEDLEPREIADVEEQDPDFDRDYYSEHLS